MLERVTIAVVARARPLDLSTGKMLLCNNNFINLSTVTFLNFLSNFTFAH